MRVVVDLHTHSDRSDGSEPPASVVAQAAAAGCRAMALTDHDTMAGIPEAAAAARAAGVELVPGCELSCLGPAPAAGGSAGGAHVLVYFAEDTGPLGDELVSLRHDRARRNHAMVERLQQAGVPVTWDAVLAKAGTAEGVGRPHVAAVLVELGAAEDHQDAFDRWLVPGQPGYVPKARLRPVDVVGLARASGGVAVLAHPLSLRLSPAELDRTVADLAAAGFAGIEAVYARYRPDQRRDLARLARRHDLVPTGGSDAHGAFTPDLSVGSGTGDLAVPDAVLAALAGRRPG